MNDESQQSYLKENSLSIVFSELEEDVDRKAMEEAKVQGKTGLLPQLAADEATLTEQPSMEDSTKPLTQEELDVLRDRVDKMMPKVPVWMPSNPMVANWNAMMAFALLTVSAITPYDLVFNELDETGPGTGLFFVNRLLDVVFLLDILFSFNIAVPDPKEPGSWIRERPGIAKTYLQGFLIIDIISVIPFDLLALLVPAVGNFKGLRLMRLMKMFRLLRGTRLLQQWEINHEVDYGVLQLSLIVAMLFFLCHWLACGWYLLALEEDNQECIQTIPMVDAECCTNWLTCHFTYTFGSVKGDDEVVITKRRIYELALNWAMGQVFTTGSSVEPTTDVEGMYTNATVVVCGILYAYLLGALCAIFASKTKQTSEYYDEVDVLNRYLQRTNITHLDLDLCRRLRMFYRYVHTSRDSMQHILDTLSPELKGQLTYQVHSQWMENMHLFHNAKDLPSSFFVSLVDMLEPVVFGPMEALIRTHQESDKFFVVQQGLVLSNHMTIIGMSGTFGDDALYAFRNKQTRGYQATSMSHGRAYSLVATEVFELMKEAEYADCLKGAMRKIMLMRAGFLMVFFNKTLMKCCKGVSMHKNNGAEDVTFGLVTARLAEELSYLKMPAFLRILSVVVTKYCQTKYGTCTTANLKRLLKEIPRDLHMPKTLVRPGMRIVEEHIADHNDAPNHVNQNTRRPSGLWNDESPATKPLNMRLSRSLSIVSRKPLVESAEEHSNSSSLVGSPTPSFHVKDEDRLDMDEVAKLDEVLSHIDEEMLAPMLYEKHSITLDILTTMSVDQMHMVGIPFGKAKDLVKVFAEWSSAVKEEKEEEVEDLQPTSRRNNSKIDFLTGSKSAKELNKHLNDQNKKIDRLEQRIETQNKTLEKLLHLVQQQQKAFRP